MGARCSSWCRPKPVVSHAGDDFDNAGYTGDRSSDKVISSILFATDASRHVNGVRGTKSDADDVFRILVETSWRTKTSILSLLTAGNHKIKKERKTEWVQLSGHSGAFSVASPWSILKRQETSADAHELLAYRQLMLDSHMKPFVPTFYREVEHLGEFFLEIEDLTHHFASPSIMDVKIGCRTFLESDASGSALRPDLYQKMVTVDPKQPTEEERWLKAITKLRYMRFREEESTTVSLSFRIEAVRTGNSELSAQHSKRLKTVKTKREVIEILHFFCAFDPLVMLSYVARLRELQSALEASDFFATHEFIGSSVLFLHDSTSRCGVWLIDFAKTQHLADGRRLRHTVQWTPGSREDGYLIGLANLICLMEVAAGEYV